MNKNREYTDSIESNKVLSRQNKKVIQNEEQIRENLRHSSNYSDSVGVLIDRNFVV